jgi:hypothetical protein
MGEFSALTSLRVFVPFVLLCFLCTTSRTDDFPRVLERDVITSEEQRWIQYDLIDGLRTSSRKFGL